TLRSKARPGSLANGSRLPIFPLGGSCRQPNAWGFPSETSPRFFAGTEDSRRCRRGRPLSQPETRLWPRGFRKKPRRTATDDDIARVPERSPCNSPGMTPGAGWFPPSAQVAFLRQSVPRFPPASALTRPVARLTTTLLLRASRWESLG